MTNARAEMEVNYFGTLAVTRAFAPVLKANGGGVVVNLSSIGGLVTVPVLGSYCASKAAVHAMTQGVRAELMAQGTRVIGVYPGPIDTDMARDFDMDKFPAFRVADALLEAVVNGTEDVFPDDMSATMRVQLLEDPKAVERQFAEMLPAA
jgi:NAD(P)-dependent dehydrogenase (short-subunit alcohol dehydrogenase family)